MSQAEWTMHMARLNYWAGVLSGYGTHHVALGQARELADHYERLVADHDAVQALGALMDLGLEPAPSRQAYDFAVYTPTSPCPDVPSRSGSHSRGKTPSKPPKPLPPPP